MQPLRTSLSQGAWRRRSKFTAVLLGVLFTVALAFVFRTRPDNTLGRDAKSVGGGNEVTTTPIDTTSAWKFTDYVDVFLWRVGLRQDMPLVILKDQIRKDVTPVTTILGDDEDDKGGVETDDSEK